jgi:uncharacterized SAM-binding protein YcdF (DUF218 family)
MSLRRVLTGAFALIATAAVAAPMLLPAAGRYLVEADPLEHADAIVVLAGSYPDRILEAVELYRAGLAPRIIVCPEPETAAFRRLAELGVDVPRPFDLNRMVAEQLGVPAAAIEVLDRAGDSTYAEAEVVLAEALRRGYKVLLLVTSKYHTHRAAEIYRFLSGGQVKVIAAPARDDDFRPDDWWRDRMSTRRLIIEYEKWISFVLIDRWRLSPVAAPSSTPSRTGAKAGQTVR